jgi:hypothetical protein
MNNYQSNKKLNSSKYPGKNYRQHANHFIEGTMVRIKIPN